MTGAPSLADALRGQRVGVALSSAFFGFFAHSGFLRALGDAGIAPAALGGTSAGALTAAFAAASPAGLDALDALCDRLRRADFWDPAPPGGRPYGLLRGERFRALLERHLPVSHFEDCVTPLITVSANLTRQSRHVDVSGPLAPAVLASCALPVMFRPVLRAGELHADGGLIDKVPVRAMIEAMAARGAPLDALVVHLIPSSGLARRTPRMPGRFVRHALDWVRDDAWRQQMAWAQARGVAVYLVETDPPRPNPFRLARGALAREAARRQTLAALR